MSALPEVSDRPDADSAPTLSHRFVHDRIHEAVQAGKPIDDAFVAEAAEGLAQRLELEGVPGKLEETAESVRTTVAAYRIVTEGLF